ncbi:enhanced serine sensitivity protein SseB [Clostridium vincentii]|uniref:Enhanced serine sensitivity protein SseB n=1 Tax=Clostridium vincentii TaxID=52704 RepID=A0A2T0BC04_9CLOT|nr:enhanced serine sensitivity protein SseB [Clostridium vincentii]PRR81363.1 enhanced serine sensitivity protein SseB [Clostridium vincentii]
MIDVNKPLTNVELVNSMNTCLNEKTVENEFAFIEKLTKANFLAPIIFKGEIENGVIKEDSTMSFKTITNSVDEAFFLAFTDWEELGKWSKQKEQTLIVPYDDLKAMVLKDNLNIKGFVINAYGQNFLITPELMEYFSKIKSEVLEVSEVVVKKNTKIFLGQPAKYPQEMVDALITFFKEHNNVDSAHLFLYSREGEEKPNLLLIIDFIGGKDELFSQVAAVTKLYLGKDEYIDLISMGDTFTKNATKDSTPFYKK